MDNQRLLVWAFFAMMLWFTYQAWMTDFRKPPPAAVESPAEATPPSGDLSLPELGDDEGAEATGESALPAVDTGDTVDDSAAAEPGASETIVVRTDVLELEISKQGGTLVRATLLRYPVHKDQPNNLVELLSPERDNRGLIRTGLRSAGADSADHHAVFTTPQDRYELGDGADLVVPLYWEDGSGLSVEKRLLFRRGEYAIQVEQTLTNESDNAWRGDQYTQLIRRSKERKRTMFDVDSYSFDGPVVYDGHKSEKLKRDDLLEKGPADFETDDGWVAAIQHHFLSAIVPEPGGKQAIRVEVRGDSMIASVVGSRQTVEPGASHTFERTLFVGPKLQRQLAEVHEKLKLTVDYGLLVWLSQPMFWLLSFVHKYVNNWGTSIIVVTIIIKALFYKLTEASGRSMAKMRNLQPRMKALQERYKDDRQQLSQQMMELYKREKVNPAAGCLPILIQMPFFLSFYWVLVESVEMRQAPFMLWITDLSERDPYFVLPLIMGAAMLLQQRLNPAPADPVQARVMQIMPIMFTGMFAFFPAGLVLYWCTNTILSIAQQWQVNRVVEREEKERKGGKKKKQKD